MMGALKQEFGDVISGEYGAIEVLDAANFTAWEIYHKLSTELPLSRTAEQQALLDRAREAAHFAKWKLDQARFWQEYHNKPWNQ